MQENILDLIKIKFGESETYARPYVFNEDADGNLVKAKTASTSCPDCGHGMDIDVEYWNGGNIHAICDNCGSGEEYFTDTPESLNANADTVFVDKSNLEDIENEIKDALNEDRNDSIKINNSGSIEIDKSKDVETLKNNCPFVDPVSLGLFVLDEI